MSKTIDLQLGLTTSPYVYLTIRTKVTLLELFTRHIISIETPAYKMRASQLLHWLAMVNRKSIGNKVGNVNDYWVPIVIGNKAKGDSSLSILLTSNDDLTPSEEMELKETRFGLLETHPKFEYGLEDFPELEWDISDAICVPLVEDKVTNEWSLSVKSHFPRVAQIVLAVRQNNWIQSGKISRSEGERLIDFDSIIELTVLDKIASNFPRNHQGVMTYTFTNYLKNKPDAVQLEQSDNFKFDFILNPQILPENPEIQIWFIGKKEE